MKHVWSMAAIFGIAAANAPPPMDRLLSGMRAVARLQTKALAWGTEKMFAGRWGGLEEDLS